MIKSGVIGAGVFGNYHAQKYINHKDTDFIGVFDIDYEKSSRLTGQHSGHAFKSIEDFLNHVDILTIATPAITHGYYGELALQNDKHVLMEKPLAADSQMAHYLVKLAKERKVTLQVGHQERFVVQQTGIFDAPKPKRIESKRVSPYSQRGLDVSVTLDLMTHDIDMTLALMGEFPIRIESNVQKRNLESHHSDYVRARLFFSNGAIAILEASRMGEDFDRKMHIEYAQGSVSIDYINKTFIHDTPYHLNPDFAKHPSAKDSLGAGVNQFVKSVLMGKQTVSSAETGAKAVHIARLIDLKHDVDFQSKPHASKTSVFANQNSKQTPSSPYQQKKKNRQSEKEAFFPVERVLNVC